MCSSDLIAPVYGLLAINGGVYGIRMLDNVRGSAIRALWALAQASMLMLLIVYFGKIAEQLSRLTLIAGLGLSALGLVMARRWIVFLARQLLGEVPHLTILIVDGVDCPEPGHAHVIDAVRAGLDPAEHDAAMAAKLARATDGAERVVVACAAERRHDWQVALQSLSARGEVMLPDLTELGPGRLGNYGDMPTIIVAGGPMQFRDRIIKRLLDIVISVGAIIALSPLLLAAALAVKLTSAGPVLFRQVRLGKDARPFMILKFRTMRQEMSDFNADKLTERNDPRITRVGAFLRKSSIDELPQLFNVLGGSMSIVGPRPHAAGAKAGEALYWEVDKRYWARHCIKPGMTGLAQVRGHRGATNEEADLVNRLQSDLEYVTGWSIWRDLGIMAATLRVLAHDNAY